MNVRRFAAYALSIAILLGLAGCYNQEDTVAENKAIANDLIDALELYEQTYGAYPDTLDELSPEFIAEIPLTVDGYEFEYRTHPAFEYELGFSLKTNPGCGYLPEYKIWECSAGVE